MADAVCVLEKLDDWTWGQPCPADLKFPPLAAEICSSPGLMPEDGSFAASIQVLWCDSGLVFFADVKDSCVENPNSGDELWLGDAVEVIIMPNGKGDFQSGPHLQVVAAPPCGEIPHRRKIYTQDMAKTAPFVFSDSALAAKGYTVTIFIQWEAFGNGAKERFMTEGFRINMYIDDYEGAVLSLNGKKECVTKPQNAPVFYPAEKIPAGIRYDLRMRYDTGADKILPEDGVFAKDLSLPCNIILRDVAGRILLQKKFPDGKIRIPCPDSGVKFLDIFAGTEDQQGLVGRKEILSAKITENISAAMQSPLTPAARVMAAGLLNAVEYFKAPSAPERKIAEEIDVRLRQIAGEDVYGAPGVLRYLNLMGDPSGSVQVGIARSVLNNQYTGLPGEYATVTVHWGGIPFIYANIVVYGNEDAAIKVMESMRFFRKDIAMPDIAGADEVYAGEGFIFGDCLPWDMDEERYVSVTNPIAPAAIVRIDPKTALDFAPAAYTVRKGARPEHVGIFREAGIKEVSPETAENIPGYIVHIGREGFDSFVHGITNYFPLYGVKNRHCAVRKGNMVVTTAFNVPEMAEEFLEAVIACRSIAFSSVDRWRRMLLDALGGDLPEWRSQGRMVRTGEVHCHTVYSDGNGTPATLLLEAAASGMEFLVITDHDSCQGAVKLAEAMKESGVSFPLITGLEITMSRAYHLNIFPLREFIDKNNRKYAEIIAEARKQGAVVMLNHPMAYGTNLRNFWYSDMKGSGIDLIERFIGRDKEFRTAGYEPAYLGSTDTHYGIFGHMERSAFLADRIDGKVIAERALAGKTAMIAPDLPELVYGAEELCKSVRAALGDDTLPACHEKRLDGFFAGFDAVKFCILSPDGADSTHAWGWSGDPEEVITAVKERI